MLGIATDAAATYAPTSTINSKLELRCAIVVRARPWSLKTQRSFAAAITFEQRLLSVGVETHRVVDG